MDKREPPTLERLPLGLLERVMTSLRESEPAALAIIVTGSYATGEATLESDLDLTVLTAMPPTGHYRTWFEPREGLALHISAGSAALADWAGDSAEPADWALSFPTEEAALFVWAVDGARAVLGEPPISRRPAAAPELEDFLECATKVKRAAARGDYLGARWHARDMGSLAPGLLIPLNPYRQVRNRREALQAALDLSVTPDGYREDLLACLGLLPLDDAALCAATLRLARSLLAFLRERAPDIDPQLYLAGYLADGTLERYLGLSGIRNPSVPEQTISRRR